MNHLIGQLAEDRAVVMFSRAATRITRDGSIIKLSLLLFYPVDLPPPPPDTRTRTRCETRGR